LRESVGSSKALMTGGKRGPYKYGKTKTSKLRRQSGSIIGCFGARMSSLGSFSVIEARKSAAVQLLAKWRRTRCPPPPEILLLTIKRGTFKNLRKVDAEDHSKCRTGTPMAMRLWDAVARGTSSLVLGGLAASGHEMLSTTSSILEHSLSL